MVEQEDEEHGPEECFYVNEGMGLGRYVLACVCGFQAEGYDGWGDAGDTMDLHIAERRMTGRERKPKR